MAQTVDQIIATQQIAINNTLAQAQTYLDSLLAQANVLLIDTPTVALPDQYNYASVPVVNFPVFTAPRPTISAPTSQVPAAPDLNFFSLQDFPMPADNLLAPTAVFAFAEQAYNTTLTDPLRAKLLADLQNGTYGIDPTDEIALLNRARDREVELAMTRIDDAGRVMAARGFPLPPGEFAIAVDRAYQELQNKVSGVNREITLDRAKRFVDARQFTITEVRQTEAVLMNYWNSVQERSLNAARITVEMAITLFNSILAMYRARLEATKIGADKQFQISQAYMEQARTRLENFRVQVAAFEANLRGIIEPARLLTDIYRADVDAARMGNDALVARTSLQQKVLESTTQQNIQISQMTIENARVRLLGTLEQLKLRTGAAQYGSEKFFALLTSLESTINTLAVQSTTV
jgi:hypothetical protein